MQSPPVYISHVIAAFLKSLERNSRQKVPEIKQPQRARQERSKALFASPAGLKMLDRTLTKTRQVQGLSAKNAIDSAFG
jgi:hypothetical protein